MEAVKCELNVKVRIHTPVTKVGGAVSIIPSVKGCYNLYNGARKILQGENTRFMCKLNLLYIQFSDAKKLFSNQAAQYSVTRYLFISSVHWFPFLVAYLDGWAV